MKKSVFWVVLDALKKFNTTLYSKFYIIDKKITYTLKIIKS